MTCRNCKHGFCWVCGRKWFIGEGGHDDYYNCKFKKEVEEKSVLANDDSQGKYLLKWHCNSLK